MKSYIICGLGNPEPKYDLTRHNYGFLVIDALASKLRLEKRDFEEKNKALYAKTVFAGAEVILVKPLTYMNASGDALGALMRYYKVPIEDLIVLVDDISIPFGTLRLRASGSAGGHNGLKSIIANIGPEFPRIRLGILNDLMKQHNMYDFVLGKFFTEELKEMNYMCETVIGSIQKIFTSGMADAMSEYNGKNFLEKK